MRTAAIGGWTWRSSCHWALAGGFGLLFGWFTPVGPAAAQENRAAAVASSGLSGSVLMRSGPPVAPHLDSLPTIAAPADDAQRRINAAVRKLDDRARKAAAACRDDSGAPGEWSRSVEVPMRGPGYIAYVIIDNVSCGGVHPVIGTQAIVYELASGAPVDWMRLLPPSLTGKLSLQGGLDGTKMVTLGSPGLYAIYLTGYDRRRSGKDDEDCRAAVREAGDSGPPPMMVWPDVKAGGLALQFDLPHVNAACADPVVIPTAALRAVGAAPALVDALDAARPQPAKPNAQRTAQPTVDEAVAVIREALARDLSPILTVVDKKDDDQRFFSHDLFEAYERALQANADAFDADPYTGVQDTTDLKVIRVSGTALDASSARVTALIDNPGFPSLTIVYRMVAEEGRWMIDDIAFSNDSSTLRASLQKS